MSSRNWLTDATFTYKRRTPYNGTLIQPVIPHSSTTVNRAKCATACAAKSYHGNCSQTCRSNLSATACEWNVHSLGIHPELYRPAGTAAEVVERVVRFVVRSTTDWFQKDAERLRTGVHKCVSPPEKASRGSRSSARRSYPAGRCARRANPLGRWQR